MTLTKRMRFEIIRRDNQTCRYCGASAPRATLTVDHVLPIALGGSDEPTNLVTACVDCNAGKSSSNPDGEVIARVSADALRWGQAMKLAGELLMAEYRERADLHGRFEDHWCQWKPAYRPHGARYPLDSNWEQSVDTFLAAGLPMEALHDCIDKAMRATHVKPESKFRYACGIAWRKVSELREIAGALIEVDQSD